MTILMYDYKYHGLNNIALQWYWYGNDSNIVYIYNGTRLHKHVDDNDNNVLMLIIKDSQCYIVSMNKCIKQLIIIYIIIVMM